MSIYESLLNAVRGSNPAFALQHAKESEQTYLKRILNEIADIPDDAFEAMPENAQLWFNFAVNKELNVQKPITPPEGMEPPPPEAPPKIQRARPIMNGSGDAQEAQPAAPAVAAPPVQSPPQRSVIEQAPVPPMPPEPPPVAAAPPAAAEPPVAAEPSRKRQARGESKFERGKERKERKRKAFSVRSVRKMVVENPELSVDDLWDACERAGQDYTRSTIVLARGQALELINIVKETGHWRD